MKQIILASMMTAVCVLVSGCASIVDGRAKTVFIESNPSGAKLSIFDKSGKPVFVETTPAVVKLKRHRGFFTGEQYKLLFEAPGCYPSETSIRSTVNGWYFGNILFGGLIGFLVVDPATGAMWTLAPKELSWNLVSSAEPLTPEQLAEATLKANPPKKRPAAPPPGKMGNR